MDDENGYQGTNCDLHFKGIAAHTIIWKHNINILVQLSPGDLSIIIKLYNFFNPGRVDENILYLDALTFTINNGD